MENNPTFTKVKVVIITKVVTFNTNALIVTTIIIVIIITIIESKLSSIENWISYYSPNSLQFHTSCRITNFHYYYLKAYDFTTFIIISLTILFKSYLIIIKVLR